MAIVKIKFALLAVLLVVIPYSVTTANEQTTESIPIGPLPMPTTTPAIAPTIAIAETVPTVEPIPAVVFCGSSWQRNDKHINVDNATIGRNLAAEYGWVDGEWRALLELWSCESGWQHDAANTEGSGAYGIPQALPADKMAANGNNWQTDPTTQIRWGLDYIKNRYGTPSAALDFHYQNNYY